MGQKYSFFVLCVTNDPKNEGDIRAGVAVDNFISYAVGSDISKHVTIEFLNSDGAPSSGELADVNSKIKLSFDDGFNAGLLNNENIIIENEKGASIPYEAASDGSTYIITPLRKLNYEECYRVRISNELRKSKSSYRPPVGAISFKTNNNRDVVIDTWSTSSAETEGKLTVNATLLNNTGADFDAAVTVVSYNNKNGVISVVRKKQNLISGRNILNNVVNIEAAVEAAKKADAVIICVGEHEAYSGEGNCRVDLHLPGVQEEQVRRVCDVNSNSAVVLFNGRPLVLNEVNKAAPAILEMWFTGT